MVNLCEHFTIIKINGWIDVWMDGWMDGWIDRWTGG